MFLYIYFLLNKKYIKIDMDSNNNKVIKVKTINENNKPNEEQFHTEKYKKKSECPNFLLKLYQILENDEYKDIIHWGDDGKYFVVKNLHDFTENILPKYYKHNNYSSFIRQLNMYDFHKRKSSLNEHIFEHKNFIKDKKELLKLIKRKTKKENHNTNNNYNLNNNYNYNLLPYPNYTHFIPNNKLLPPKETDLVQIIPNQNFNKDNIIYNNNRKSSFSIDDNLSLNNSIHSFIPFKKMPLLPMGTTSSNNIDINNNINNNNFNINNNNFNNFNINNLNGDLKDEKKITKKNLQNLLNYLMHSIDENSETQKQLEIKIERLTKQNEEFMNQNKKMLEEIKSKKDYNKKLEAVICFILEMITSKPKMKNNQELKNLFLTNEPNNQFHDPNNLNKLGLVNFNSPKHEINGILSNDYLSNNNIGGMLDPFQAFLTKYYERTKNNGLLANKENNINNQEITKYNNNNMLLDEDKYYYPTGNIDPNLNAKILKNNLIGDSNENNYQLSPYILKNKRKRSSSFNSILSNLSKGSNIIYNNNKLLPGEEDKKIDNNLENVEEKEEELNSHDPIPPVINNDKIEEKINDKNENNSNINFSRKDSISSWNESKNIFDLDLNPDENKSYLSGWNKDLLNNSQSSFNDIYDSNINKDNDILSDINN